jgi:hypothetical protein
MSDHKSKLLEKISSKSATVGVIGFDVPSSTCTL